jgi:hypothetical protein
VNDNLLLSADARTTAGILLLTIVFVEYGGTYLLRIVRGRSPVTEFQRSFARAGHAHAGVLVSLALVCQVLADSTDLTGTLAAVARSGVPLAAILMPAGFFFSSMGRDVTRPNRFIVLLWVGAASLSAGVVTLGIGLLSA